GRRSGGRQGPGQQLRAGAAAPRASGGRQLARTRGRHAAGACARAAAPDIAVVLAARRHARDPARNHCQRIGVAMMSTESAEQRVLLADTLARLFRDSATTQAAVSEGWNATLWQELDHMGLPQLMVSEAAGGIGGTWEDAQVVAQAVGAHAVGLPVCEAILAHAVAAQVGLVLHT